MGTASAAVRSLQTSLTAMACTIRSSRISFANDSSQLMPASCRPVWMACASTPPPCARLPAASGSPVASFIFKRPSRSTFLASDASGSRKTFPSPTTTRIASMPSNTASRSGELRSMTGNSSSFLRRAETTRDPSSALVRTTLAPSTLTWNFSPGAKPARTACSPSKKIRGRPRAAPTFLIQTSFMIVHPPQTAGRLEKGSSGSSSRLLTKRGSCLNVASIARAVSCTSWPSRNRAPLV